MGSVDTITSELIVRSLTLVIRILALIVRSLTLVIRILAGTRLFCFTDIYDSQTI